MLESLCMLLGRQKVCVMSRMMNDDRVKSRSKSPVFSR